MESARVADVGHMLILFLGRIPIRSSAVRMGLSTLNSINDHLQTVAISSDHEDAASFIILSYAIGSEPFTFSDITVH